MLFTLHKVSKFFLKITWMNVYIFNHISPMIDVKVHRVKGKPTLN